MKSLSTACSLILVLLFLFAACHSSSTDDKTDRVEAKKHTYNPLLGTLRIASDVRNPEMTAVKLLNDKRIDSLAAATPDNGTFTLTVDQVPVQEVYFLEISGTSTKRGTSGLDWTEYVPVYLEKTGELHLHQQVFDHPGSISKATFSIAGGSEEQQLLNDWQLALNDEQAEEEGRLTHYTPGGGGSVKVPDGGNGTASADKLGVTQRFIQQKKPLVASLFLAYTANDHRDYTADYAALYDAVPDDARRTKYGIDLSQRLDRILHPIKQLHPATQLQAVDGGLKPLDWAAFDDYRYLLLSFWSTTDHTVQDDVKRLETEASALEAQKTAVIYLSVDSKLSHWKKMSQPLNLQHNYKLRNEVQQSLIDSLYMTALPRQVLIQPDGTVIDADVTTAELPDLLRHVE
ncbi:thioredoxin-like domain-containing protein [Parapedobacter sp. DT-150]|uniref:thioredoxin-like domain-containing protein n=1 Tax=Parapedobacter sp. DT-150 TaxID=3396162 RepID=UPI003F1DF665